MSSSTFYNRLRHSLAVTAGGGLSEPNGSAAAARQGSSSETLNKLRQLAARRTSPTAFDRGHEAPRNTATATHPQPSSRGDRSSFMRSPPASSTPQKPTSTQNSVTQAVDGEGLTAAEVDAIRVAEIDSKFSVSASVSSPNGGDRGFTHLADDTTIKVFPRHVVFSRADGSPVVELVIAELFELTEDATRNSLSFHLQRTSGVAVIAVSCASNEARSVLYKLVCAKRNALEAAA